MLLYQIKDGDTINEQLLTCPDGIAAFFDSLGYNADDKSVARIKQSPSALGIAPEMVAKSINHVGRIADQENGG